MPSVFKNPTIPRRPQRSFRQKQYLAARKEPERGHVIKHEQSIQLQARDWFVAKFPGEHLRSDTGSGSFGSAYEKDTHNRQQSHIGEPDISIFAMRRGYGGLLIELKAECHCKVKNPHPDCAIRMQSNGRVARIYKNSRGKVIGRDLLPRKKGEWKDMHTERQAKNLEDYMRKGYYAHFAIGLEAFKKICCWYFDVPYEPPIENASMF